MISSQRQRGMTGAGWVAVLGLIAFFTLITLKLLPIYIDGYTVKSALYSLESESGITRKSPTMIKSMLLKRLDINMITDVGKDDIYIEKSGGTMTIEVDYEVRTKVAGNLDVVVTFNHVLELPSN